MILITALFVLWFISTTSAQDAKLIEAAKKEGGKVVAYGSLENTAIDPIIDAFEKKTAIKVEYFRSSATKAMERGLTELRAGKAIFDVMVNNSGAIEIMRKENIFAKYISPAAANFPKSEIDPVVGPAYRHTPIGIIYNKSALSAADAPKSLEELLNPKYRGKVAMPDPTQHTTTMQWLASLYKIMGKEKADNFIRDLGATRPILTESFAPAAERRQGFYRFFLERRRHEAARQGGRVCYHERHTPIAPRGGQDPTRGNGRPRQQRLRR